MSYRDVTKVHDGVMNSIENILELDGVDIYSMDEDIFEEWCSMSETLYDTLKTVYNYEQD